MKTPAERRKREKVIVIVTFLHADRSGKVNRLFNQPMAGLHVASLIDREKYDVTLYHEMWHGPFDTKGNLEDYSMVILSGLHKDLDRMRQLSYHFRKAGVVVVAGGSFCTLFPDFAQEFFDVVCTGGVDSVRGVFEDYENGGVKPRYDSPQQEISDYRIDHRYLADAGIKLPLHPIEASRGCNFKCDFCVIPAEGATYARFGLEAVSDNIDDAIRNTGPLDFRRHYPMVSFIDNNLSGDFAYLRALCDHLAQDGRVKGWSGLVTQNLLRSRKMIDKMAASKCVTLFVGIESLNTGFHEAHSKRQNMVEPESLIEDIDYAQKKGIVIIYGYIFDPRITPVEQMRQEIEWILRSDVLNYPTYIGFVTPLLGTQLFWENIDNGELLPSLLVRDLEANTVAWSNTRSSLEELSELARDLYIFNHKLASRRRILLKTMKSVVRYRLPPAQAYILLNNNLNVVKQNRGAGAANRSYLGGSDLLDPSYHDLPPGLSAEDRRRYFDPIQITEADGSPASWIVSGRRSEAGAVASGPGASTG